MPGPESVPAVRLCCFTAEGILRWGRDSRQVGSERRDCARGQETTWVFISAERVSGGV